MNGTVKKPPLEFWLTAALLVYLWLALLNQLRADWAIYPEYAYGWSVPVLGAFLFWRRWRCRPAPAAPSHVGISTFFSIILLLILCPMRLLQEANPDWRLLGWVQAGCVVGTTLVVIYRAGGASWLRHFLFPTAFILIAVPWSRPFEQQLTQLLMPLVAGITVEGLFVAGVSAVQHGNLIEVTTGLVGIDEACSGIRSLQATLMASMFLGELYRMTRTRRVVLIVAGILIAFGLNIARAMFLAYVAARNGLKAIDKWHDPAGFTILAVCMVALFLVAMLFRARLLEPENPSPDSPQWLPRSCVIAGIVWLITIEVGVEWWFRSRESRAIQTPAWNIAWPLAKSGYRVQTISPPVREALGFDQGSAASWLEADGTRWTAFYFEWSSANPGLRGIKYHKPDICLPASGRILEADLGTKLVTVQQIVIPCRVYRFRDSGRALHVFYCLSEDGVDYTSAAGFIEENTRESRTKRVLAGKRFNHAQRVLEVIVQGMESTDHATAAFQGVLSAILRPGSVGSLARP